VPAGPDPPPPDGRPPPRLQGRVAAASTRRAAGGPARRRVRSISGGRVGGEAGQPQPPLEADAPCMQWRGATVCHVQSIAAATVPRGVQQARGSHPPRPPPSRGERTAPDAGVCPQAPVRAPVSGSCWRRAFPDWRRRPPGCTPAGVHPDAPKSADCSGVPPLTCPCPRLANAGRASRGVTSARVRPLYPQHPVRLAPCRRYERVLFVSTAIALD